MTVASAGLRINGGKVRDWVNRGIVRSDVVDAGKELRIYWASYIET